METNSSAAEPQNCWTKTKLVSVLVTTGKVTEVSRLRLEVQATTVQVAPRQ